MIERQRHGAALSTIHSTTCQLPGLQSYILTPRPPSMAKEAFLILAITRPTFPSVVPCSLIPRSHNKCICSSNLIPPFPTLLPSAQMNFALACMQCARRSLPLPRQESTKLPVQPNPSSLSHPRPNERKSSASNSPHQKMMEVTRQAGRSLNGCQMTPCSTSLRHVSSSSFWRLACTSS